MATRIIKMEKEYSSKILVRRLLCSISAIIMGLPCFIYGIVGENENFPLLRFLRVLTLHERITINEIFTFTLGVMAFFSSIIFLVMIIGWIFNLPSDRSWKIIIVIGTICWFPNTLICFSLENFFKRIDLLIIPLASLVLYLTFWYFSDQTNHHDKSEIQ